MLNETEPSATLHEPRRTAALTGGGKAGKRTAQDSAVKSATRALEIIELFAVHRHPLSVSEIAGALAIPQSSSSVLLQAISKAGFIARDRQTRKYVPSVRSVFLGNWIHDALFHRGSLLQALESLGERTEANVRLGMRNGIHVQYVYASWADADPERPGPGIRMPICHDALGRMLLSAESDKDARGIARHANALGDGLAVNVETLMRELARCRAEGFAECDDPARAGDRVLAILLPAQFGAQAVIGLGLAAGRLPRERARLLDMLNTVVKDAWGSEAA